MLQLVYKIHGVFNVYVTFPLMTAFLWTPMKNLLLLTRKFLDFSADTGKRSFFLAATSYSISRTVFDLLYCISGDSLSVLVSVNIGPGARNEPELFHPLFPRMQIIGSLTFSLILL